MLLVKYVELTISNNTHVASILLSTLRYSQYIQKFCIIVYIIDVDCKLRNFVKLPTDCF